MAEDKRIRVSADASPLQELRQSAQSLWDELIRMEGRFKSLADETTSSIQKQIEFLKERNSLLGRDISGGSTQRQSLIIDPSTGRYTDGRPVPPNSAGGNQNINVFERIYAQITRLTDIIERGSREEQNKPDEEKRGGRVGGLFNFGGIGRGGNSFGLPTSIMGLMSLLPGFGLIAGVGAMLSQQARYNNQKYFSENSLLEDNQFGRHWLVNALTFGISGAMADKSEKEIRAAMENDKVMREYTGLFSTSYQGSLGRQLKENFSSDIIKNKGGNKRQYVPDMYDQNGFLISKGYYRDITLPDKYEVNLSEYDKDKRISNWSSTNLGVDFSEYTKKLISLQKSGVSRKNISVNDINQLLLSQVLTGLDDSTLGNIQAATRYSRNLTGAGVVQGFYDAAKKNFGNADVVERNISFQEQINAFNTIANKLASTKGSYNAGNLMRSMTSIQNTTGFKGQQLQRVQGALTGGNFSQDEVTQAFLLNAVREMNPEMSYFDALAELEGMQDNPELGAKVLQKIYDISGGGENFKFMASAMYKDLNKNDIKKVAERLSEGKSAEDILMKSSNKMGTAFSEKDASKGVNQLDKEAAERKNYQILQGYQQYNEDGIINLSDILNTDAKPLNVKVVNFPAGISTEQMEKFLSQMKGFSVRPSETIGGFEFQEIMTQGTNAK